MLPKGYFYWAPERDKAQTRIRLKGLVRICKKKYKKSPLGLRELLRAELQMKH